MYRLFCCRNRKTSRVEVDEITDSLEKCLSVERGVAEFRSFLETHYFEQELTTLTFALRCQRIITDISRVSPVTRGMGLPDRIQRDIRDLYRMADDINFDLSQMNTLSNLDSTDVGEKNNGRKFESPKDRRAQCYLAQTFSRLLLGAWSLLLRLFLKPELCFFIAFVNFAFLCFLEDVIPGPLNFRYSRILGLTLGK